MLSIDLPSLERSSTGAIHGVICVRLGPHAFPDPGWDDLVLPITRAWIEALARLGSGRAQTAEVHFMDGPFQVLLVRDGPRVTATGLKSRLDGVQIQSREERDLRAMTSEALDTASALVLECRRRGWRNADLDQLIEALGRPG